MRIEKYENGTSGGFNINEKDDSAEVAKGKDYFDCNSFDFDEMQCFGGKHIYLLYGRIVRDSICPFQAHRELSK